MDWWSEKETRMLVDKYHDNHARPLDLGEIRENHHKIITGLRDKLKADGTIEDVAFQGSAYTGVHIGPEKEFDVCFIMPGKGLDIRKCDHNGEYAYLYAKPDEFKHTKFLKSDPNGERFVDPTKVRSAFFGKIAKHAQDVCKELDLTYTVKPRGHGPATQLDVFDSPTSKKPLYSVDLVPSFREDKASGATAGSGNVSRKLADSNSSTTIASTGGGGSLPVSTTTGSGSYNGATGTCSMHNGTFPAQSAAFGNSRDAGTSNDSGDLGASQNLVDTGTSNNDRDVSASEFKSKPRQFVAKPVKAGCGLAHANILFRQSFSEIEKEYMQKISKGNQCQKKVVRVIKAMQHKHGHGAGLQKFTSYHIYSAVWAMDKHHQEPSKWAENQTVHRVMDTLGYMKGCMEDRHMEHPFEPGVNLIQHWNPATCQNNENRIRNICSKQNTFNKIMSS